VDHRVQQGFPPGFDFGTVDRHIPDGPIYPTVPKFEIDPFLVPYLIYFSFYLRG
jgi:hypothetical protein